MIIFDKNNNVVAKNSTTQNSNQTFIWSRLLTSPNTLYESGPIVGPRASANLDQVSKDQVIQLISSNPNLNKSSISVHDLKPRSIGLRDLSLHSLVINRRLPLHWKGSNVSLHQFPLTQNDKNKKWWDQSNPLSQFSIPNSCKDQMGCSTFHEDQYLHLLQIIRLPTFASTFIARQVSTPIDFNQQLFFLCSTSINVSA